MSRALLAALLVAIASCAPAREVPLAPVRGGGNLVLIGGGAKPADVMQLFVDLAGGPRAKVVVLPMASEEPREVGAELARILSEHGVADITVLHIDDRRDALRDDYARAVREATGVFFGGGDQRRIASRIVDTPLLDAIFDVKARGGVVGGTSAGSVCQSAIMITGDGDEGSLAPHSMVVTRGTGLFEGVVIDSHFVVRRRFARLQSVVLDHPQLLGVGIDEATAAWVKPDGTMEVRGQGQVIVYDGSRARASSRDGVLAVVGMKTYSLSRGQRFDLQAHQVLP